MKKVMKFLFLSLILIGLISVISGASEPSVIVSSPLNQTYTSLNDTYIPSSPIYYSIVLFNITGTDVDGISMCWFNLNNGTNRTLINQMGTDYYTYINSSISDGQYQVRFFCNDTAGNVNRTTNLNFTLATISQIKISSSLHYLSISDSSLKVYFAFDDNTSSSNVVYDYTNNSNNGILINSPDYVSNGYIGGAYKFSKGNDYITVDDSYGSLNFANSNLTLSIWVKILRQPNNVKQITTGNGLSCLIDSLGFASCWGAGIQGGIGDNLTTDNYRSIPIPVYGNYNFSHLSSASGFVCGLLVNGTIMCWGSGDYGNLGVNSTNDINIPQAITGNYVFSEMSYGGSDYACGILTNGSALCWGRNVYGGLGDNSTTQRNLPTPVNGSYNFSKIFIGEFHTCGILTNGSALCWGNGGSGQLGNNRSSNVNVPVAVNGSYNFSYMGLGSAHTCGILTNGSALCWGFNDYGELGINSTTNKNIPNFVYGNYTFSMISANGYNTCGILTNGSALCWGWNYYGQVGNGSSGGQINVPVMVSGDYNFSQISSGYGYNCGILTNGSALCWGKGNSGELGIGYVTPGNGVGDIHIPTNILRGTLFGKNNYYSTYAIAFDSNNSIYGIVRNNVSVLNTSLNSEEWNHILLTSNGSIQSLYLNGNLVNTRDTYFLDVGNPYPPIVIGQNAQTLIDEVMIYDKYLNSTEIQDVYNNQSVRFNVTGNTYTTQSIQNRLNIVLDNCSTLMGTIIQASIEGTWRNFSGCSLNNLETTAGTQNITIRLLSDAYRFYTPNILGNITFTSWTYTAPAPAESPTGGSSGAPKSSNPIYVPSALKESFWTQTTVVMESNWEEVAQPVLTEDTQQPITEEQAITLEQELLNELNTNPDAEIQEIAVKEFSENLSVTERLKITEKNTTAYIGVASISGDSAVVQVSSGGGGGGGTTQSIMKLGETKSFDLNGDGLNDIRITLMKIDPKLRIGIKIAVIYNGLLPAKEIPEYEQEQKSNKLLILSLVVVGFLIVVTVFLRFRKYK